MDLLESVKARLEAAGIGNVHARLADAAKHDEFAVVTFAAPSAVECFYDMSLDMPARVTIVILRRSDFQAMQEATAAFRQLQADPPESLDGSYKLTGMDMTLPAPVTWDESGRRAWAFDISLTFAEKGM